MNVVIQMLRFLNAILDTHLWHNFCFHVRYLNFVAKANQLMSSQHTNLEWNPHINYLFRTVFVYEKHASKIHDIYFF